MVLDALFGALESEASDRVVSALIAAIGRICSSNRVLKLSPYLESKDDRIVSNAIEAIGQARDPRAADTILPLLYSRHNRVKANAAMALFASGRIEVISTLKPMLLHSDPLMRSSAAFAIGELTIIAQKDKLLEELRLRGHEVKMFLAELQECVPMLVSLLKDGEPIVKRQAIIALGKIRDKSSVLPIIDTLDLERDNKELIQDIARSLRAIGSHKLVREVLDKLS
jgi:HEAT repeat protein